jgi:hypothetical protein
VNIHPEDHQNHIDDLLDDITRDEALDPTEFLGKLLDRRTSGDLGKLVFRDAAVLELLLLEDAVAAGRLSQDEYERWEQKVADLAYDPVDLAERALIESAFEALDELADAGIESPLPALPPDRA